MVNAGTRRRFKLARLGIFFSFFPTRAAAQTGQDDTPPEDAHGEAEPPEEEGRYGFTLDEGFRLKSADERYRLRIGLTAAFKFEPTWTEGDHAVSGVLAFVRPSFTGNFYKPWLRYAVAMELADSSAFLLGANVEVQPWDELGFRFGQQGTPVSRHTSFGPAQIFFPDYAAVASYFWSGRNKGLTVFGSVAEGRFDYFAGIYGGSPLRDPEVEDPGEDLNYVADARATVSPLGPVNGNELPFTPEGEPLPTRFSFTVQGYYGKLQATEENFNPTNSILTPEQPVVTRVMGAVGGDLWFQTGPAIVFAEGYYRRFRSTEEDDSHASYGVWGQAMVNAYRNLIGVGARANWFDPNRDLESDRVLELEGQVAWFIHPPELVLKLRYAWLEQDSPDEAELGAFELPFAPGTSHVGTLQLTLAI